MRKKLQEHIIKVILAGFIIGTYPSRQSSLAPKRIETPEQAHAFLENFWKYQTDIVVPGEEDDWQSLEKTLEKKGGDCDDYAIASIALLQERYPGDLLWLQGEKLEHVAMFQLKREKFSHGVHLLSSKGNYGLLEEGRYMPVQYDSIESLVQAWSQSQRIIGPIAYCVITLPRTPELINGKGNLHETLKPYLQKTEWKSVP